MNSKQRIKASVQMFREAAEVGARLRVIRATLDVSQTTAASELFISRERLANYEAGRTPLKVEVGLDACRAFIFSEKWLATGEGDPQMSKNLRDDPIFKHVKAGSFYGAAYREVLAARYDELLRSDPLQPRFARLGESIFYDANILKEFVQSWSYLLSGPNREALMNLLIKIGNDFAATHIEPGTLLIPKFFEVGAHLETTVFISPKLKQLHARAVKLAARRENSGKTNP